MDGTQTPGEITAYQRAVDEYRSAKAALEVTRPGTLTHVVAQDVVDSLGSKDWDYLVECVACARTCTIRASTQEIASWKWRPRVLCGTCGSGTKIALVES